MYKNSDVFKVGGIKFTFEELKKEFFDNQNEYIISYKTIYQVFYSENAGFYGIKVFYNHNQNDIGYTRLGRFIFSDSNFINKLVGFELLNV